jgi:hypothetical protein
VRSGLDERPSRQAHALCWCGLHFQRGALLDACKLKRLRVLVSFVFSHCHRLNRYPQVFCVFACSRACYPGSVSPSQSVHTSSLRLRVQPSCCPASVTASIGTHKLSVRRCRRTPLKTSARSLPVQLSSVSSTAPSSAHASSRVF